MLCSVWVAGVALSGLLLVSVTEALSECLAVRGLYCSNHLLLHSLSLLSVGEVPFTPTVDRWLGMQVLSSIFSCTFRWCEVWCTNTKFSCINMKCCWPAAVVGERLV